MIATRKPKTGQFCWVDLAATNAQAARSFYGRAFAWRAASESAGSGAFSRFLLGDTEIASFYQLRERHLASGVPSHWTPYIAVDDADESAERAHGLGASVLVRPFDVLGFARIALLQDPIGALVGLWQCCDVAAQKD